MPRRTIDRSLDEDSRRARVPSPSSPRTLTVVAGVMLAHGFPLSLLNRLIRIGLATSHIEREERPDKPIEIVRLRITEAGRRALL